MKIARSCKLQTVSQKKSIEINAIFNNNYASKAAVKLSEFL